MHTESGEIGDVQELVALVDELNSHVHKNSNLLRATDFLEFDSALDIGFGRGGASLYFALAGKRVTAISLHGLGVTPPAEVLDERYPAELMDRLGIERIACDFRDFPEERRFDLIWMSHVMEHTLDVGAFLRKAHRLLSDGGWLCVMVPAFKHQVVMGHVSTGWNLGQLMHALAVTGFNIRGGHFIKHGYNVCAFVRKGNALEEKIAAGASWDELSIAALTEPLRDELWPITARQGFHGELEQINWFREFHEVALSPWEPDYAPWLGIDRRAERKPHPFTTPRSHTFGADEIAIEHFDGAYTYEDPHHQLRDCLALAPRNGYLMEFGVSRGGSINFIADIMPERRIWGFYSFEGLPEVRRNVWLVKGLFGESLPKWLEENDSRVAFLHIGTNFYSSAKTILSLLDRRFMPGTVIVFYKLSDRQDEATYEIQPENEWHALLEWLVQSGRRVRILSRTEKHGAAIQIA